VIELRQLAALVAVADHGTFSAAAKALFTVQSNVSAHIARLETELGMILIDRQRGTLTEGGKVVVARARTIHHELDAIRADITSMADEVTGDVRLGVIGTTARWLVPSILQILQTRHPRVRAVVVEASTTSLIPQLSTGRLDLAVVNMPVDDPDVTTDELFDEEMVLVAPTQHPLAARESVTLSELSAHPMLLGAPGTALRDDLETELARAGVKLRAQAEIDGVRLMASLAFEGFGAAILPATAVPSWLEGDWRRVQVDGLPRRKVGLAHRRRGLPSAPARALSEVILDVVAQQGPSQPGLHLRVQARCTPPE
jgi:DNA-binding transcriptional LysR family regulator